MSKAELLTLIPKIPQPRVDIVIGEGLLKDDRLLQACRSFTGRAAIVADSAICSTYGRTLKESLSAELLPFPGGEKSKTRENKQKFEDELLKRKFGRDTLLIGLGGGVTTDFAAFLASTYMRGVPLILIPTTLLAMVDAGVGGKTGVDTPFGKNIIGSFYHPKAIFVDLSLLASLPEKEWTCGLAEILKYGLIADPVIWRQLEESPADWKKHLYSLVLASIRVKKAVIEEDPFEEKGLRRMLNFGHTVAHALEHLSHYELSHGEAVAIGCVAESWLSHRLGYLPKEEFSKIEQLFHKFPFAFKLPKQFQRAPFLEAIQMDKKSKGAVFINSSQDSGERGKAKSKRSGPNDESIAEGAMDEKEDRSGKAAAGRQVRFVLIDRIGHTLPFEGAYCRPVDSKALEELIDWLSKKYG